MVSRRREKEEEEIERSERLTGSKTLGLSCPPITIIHQLTFRILTFTRITRRTHPCRAPAHGLAKCINTLALCGGILWREQPAPETVHEHRGTKVAPERRLDGYVWKSSLWKSFPQPNSAGLGRCIHRLVNAMWVALHKRNIRLKRKMWRNYCDLGKTWFSRRDILFVHRNIMRNLFISQTVFYFWRLWRSIYYNDNVEIGEKNVILDIIRSRILPRI